MQADVRARLHLVIEAEQVAADTAFRASQGALSLTVPYVIPATQDVGLASLIIADRGIGFGSKHHSTCQEEGFSDSTPDLLGSRSASSIFLYRG